MDDAGQELAVDGSGGDDLSRGHGRDAVQGLVLGVLVLGTCTQIPELYGTQNPQQEDAFGKPKCIPGLIFPHTRCGEIALAQLM